MIGVIEVLVCILMVTATMSMILVVGWLTDPTREVRYAVRDASPN